MAQRDISSGTGGWTHTDPSSTLTETPYRIRWESHVSSDTAYQYKAETVSGNFTHYVTFGFDSSTGSGMGVWAVSDTVGTIISLTGNASAHALMLFLEDSGTSCKLKLTERDGSTLVQTGEVTLAEAYRYRALYLKVNRTSSALTVGVYRDPARTELLYSISQTLNSVQTYTNILLAQSGGVATDQTSGGTQNSNTTLVNTTSYYQTFTPSVTHALSWVSAKLLKYNTGCTQITAALFATSGGVPTGSALATSNTYDPSGWSTSYADHLFVFPTPYTVNASTVYALKIYTNSSTANNCRWAASSANPYAGGAAFTNTTETSGYDQLFSEGYGYAGTASGFTSALYTGDAPEIFTPQRITELMYVEDYETNFASYPSSHETWTESGADGSASIAVSGGGLLITGVDGADDKSAYFSPSNTTFGGGVVSADVKVTALGTGAYRQLLTMYSASGYVQAFVKEASGTIYFRLNNNGTWGTETAVSCTIDTTYRIALIKSNYTEYVALSVNGIHAASAAHALDWTPSRIYVGAYVATDAYKGGTVLITNLKYMNGTAYKPWICRGGTDNNTLVAGFIQDDNHVATANSIARYQYSNDDGATWTDFWSYAATGGVYAKGSGGIRWCEARNSWYFFISMKSATVGEIFRVYECTSLTTPTVTLIYDYYVSDSRQIIIWPTREVNESGLLYVGVEDWTSGVVLNSALFNFATGALTSEYKICDGDDLAGYTIAAEPMLWHDSTGALCSTIRFTVSGGATNAVRYKVSTDDGASAWPATLIDPGTDWYQRNAMMRAFVFRGSCWWQGRDNQTAIGPVAWDSFIFRTDQDPDAADRIPVREEWWWKAVGEGGNGDMDAKVEPGPLYLDFVSDIYGTAFFMRLDTNEVGNYVGVIFF